MKKFLTYTQRRARPGARAMFLFALAPVFILLAGCATRKPLRIEPLSFRRCAITNDAQGFIGCDCAKPVIVWDAQAKRKVVYCDGKVQQ